MNNKKPTEQFEILSNALRIFPERVMALRYYVEEVNDPEEGINNIESAFRDVLNQFYGMVGTLKEQSVLTSLYCHDSFNTLLCLRHSIQHGSGKVKNLFRDVILDQNLFEVAEIEFSYSDKDMGRCPYLISADWIETGVKNSNYANKWKGIATYWNIDSIKTKIASKDKKWDNVYLDATILITEAMRELVHTYGQYFSPSGYDSDVYHEHFSEMERIDATDYSIKFNEPYMALASNKGGRYQG